MASGPIAQYAGWRLDMGQRSWAIDAVRGLAIVLMLIDHVCTFVITVFQATGVPAGLLWAVRLSFGRVAMPLFMLCTGVLLARKHPSIQRRWAIAALGVGVSSACAHVAIGIGSPDILLTWSAVMVAAVLIRHYPVAVVCVGVVQATVFPIPWRAYQPGILAAIVAAGVLGGYGCLHWGDRLPAPLASVGRRPLRWYVGHLVVLLAAGALLGRAV